MRRIYLLLLVIIFLMSSLLYGCGTSKEGEAKDTDEVKNDSETNEPGIKTTEFSFWTFVELHKQFYDDAVVTWNNDNPGSRIVLKSSVYPYDEMHNKLLISLQSGVGAPDIVDIEASRYPVFLKGNISLLPLNSIVEPIEDKLIMSRLENYAKDGFYYGIDYHVGTTVAYYNKGIFAKAGVNPSNIKLWSDFVEAGKKIKKATGKPMTTIEVKNMWSFYPLISQQGSDFLDKDGEVIVDNETNIKTLEFLYDMIYKEKIAITTPGGEHYTEEYFAFMSDGGAASVIMPLWFMGRFIKYMPDLKGKLIICPMPAWEEGGSRSAGMGGTGTSITNQCNDIGTAKEFLAAAKLSKEGSLKTWTILGFDPIRNDVYDMHEINEDNMYTEYFGNGIMDVVKSVKDEINPVHLNLLYPDATNLIARTTLFKVLKEQSMTPEEGLKSAAQELRSKK